MPPQLRRIADLAGAQARELHHDWVGPDHLVLALLQDDCPGTARQIVASFGVSYKDVRDAFVESMGDPFDGPVGWQKVAPATMLALERARRKAVELGHTKVSGQHVLLALTDRWLGGVTTSYLARRGLDVATVGERVAASGTGGPEASQDQPESRVSQGQPSPASQLSRRFRPVAERRIPRPAEPPLAPTPQGRDPHRRGPWGSAVFHDANGQPITQGVALRQYFIDRDGNPVLTSDGRPVHLLIDEDGRHILDEAGDPILSAVDIPPGSAVATFSRRPSSA